MSLKIEIVLAMSNKLKASVIQWLAYHNMEPKVVGSKPGGGNNFAIYYSAADLFESSRTNSLHYTGSSVGGQRNAPTVEMSDHCSN